MERGSGHGSDDRNQSGAERADGDIVSVGSAVGNKPYCRTCGKYISGRYADTGADVVLHSENTGRHCGDRSFWLLDAETAYGIYE